MCRQGLGGNAREWQHALYAHSSATLCPNHAGGCQQRVASPRFNHCRSSLPHPHLATHTHTQHVHNSRTCTPPRKCTPPLWWGC